MQGTRSAASALIAVMIVAACASTGPTPVPAEATPTPAASGTPTATPAPVPTATPTPTPQPTPADASSAFLRTITATSFSAKIALTGQAKLGTVSTTTKGMLELSTGTSHLVLTNTTAGKARTSESITGYGSTFTKADGLWFKAGAARTDDLASILRGAKAVTQLGIESRDGQDLHHLSMLGIDTVPIELALTDPTITNKSVTIDAWALPDGTPVQLTFGVTWDQTVAKKPVSGTRTLDLAFSDVGSAVSVTIPTEVWTRYTSKRYGYQMAYPVDWEFKAGTSKFSDAYFGASDSVFASRARRFGVSLAGITRQIKSQLAKITGMTGIKIDSNKPAKLNGVAARRIEFHGSYKGDATWAIAVYAARGSWWYFIEYDTYDKVTAADRALFTQFLGSFRFK